MDFLKLAKRGGIVGGTGFLMLISNSVGQHERAIASTDTRVTKIEEKLDKIVEITTRTQINVEYLMTGFPSLHKPKISETE